MTPEEKAVIDVALALIVGVRGGIDPASLDNDLEAAVDALIFACPQCNAGGHACPGCGASIGHTQTACASCNEELDADVREAERVAAIYELAGANVRTPSEERAVIEAARSWEMSGQDDSSTAVLLGTVYDLQASENLAAPEWVPATLILCLAGDHIRMGADETDVTRSSAGIWHADTSNAWQPKAWRHTELRMDLTANPGFQQYPPNLECEILCTPERKATFLLQQAFPGSVIVSSDVD